MITASCKELEKPLEKVNSAGKEESESGSGIVGEASGGKGAVTDSEDQLSDDDNPKSVASRSNSEQSAESREEVE